MNQLKQLNIKLNNIRNEFNSIEQQMKLLKQRRLELKGEMHSIEVQMESFRSNIDGSRDRFLQNSYPWSEQAQSLLESVFKLQNFRLHQLSAINATLSGYDVLLIMPTGGGKSLCFQLAALISKGLTLVVSPLISLMEDQLNSLKELGIPTAILSSSTDQSEFGNILRSIGEKEIPFRILYVTPEKLAKSKRLISQLEKCYNNDNFKRLVIDEVHCCSQWGHDFRTDYQFLRIMRNQFPETPIIGLTATATPMVIKDIQKILNIKGCYIFKDSFFRENLCYTIQKVQDNKDDLIEKISNLLKYQYADQSGLIYCLTIKDVEEVTYNLCSKGIKAVAYHAQLLPEQKTRAYKRWYQNEEQVIVATIAFGMGINKNDVRFVFHYSMSKSLENYYQETGRAGRDGKPADCILFFKFTDIFRVTALVFSEHNGLSNVYAMLSYCLNRTSCRKEQIANYFSDRWNQQCQNHCDNCQRKDSYELLDIRNDMSDIEKILSYAIRFERRITALKLLDLWLGKGEKKLRPDNMKVTEHSRETAQDILAFLLVHNYLKEEFHFTPYSTISYINVGTAWIMKKDSLNFKIEFNRYTEHKKKNYNGNSESSDNTSSSSNKRKK